jgi:hypothetical protein
MFLANAANVIDDRIVSHDHGSINSSGVQITGGS